MEPSTYRTPRDLELTQAPIKRIIIVGSCFASAWPEVFMEEESGSKCEFYLFNNATLLPDELPGDSEFDFQIVQLPIRTVLSDQLYFGITDDSEAAFDGLLAETEARLRMFLANAMKWNSKHGVLTFVTNFMVPQQNPLGRLMARYDLRNVVYFFERLNQTLAIEVAAYKNAYLLDVDQIAATYGRRHIQDDVVWQFNHGSSLSNADFGLDRQRLEPIERATHVFGIRNNAYIKFIWAELRAMYRTIRQVDPVKLVVVDIDDTLWRGVAAERLDHNAEHIEGWPLGFVDALGYLKRRGVLLAVASKNDEQRVAEIWEKLFGNRISLDDFVCRKINWRPKADNFEEILAETNLLPKNVVFVDDNPVERESVRVSFPDVRVMGGSPYNWRRILLWAPETQVAAITSESTRRTIMVKAQIEREQQRGHMTREDFLLSLSLKVSIRCLDDSDVPGFARALELINKTNQFNTTGDRWTAQRISDRIIAGLRVFTFSASDIYTEYGIVGVILIDSGVVVQFVMSCRTAGMEVEHAALAKVLEILEGQGVEAMAANYIDTGLNLLCKDFFARAGFYLDGGVWRHSMKSFFAPTHVEVNFLSD